MIMNDDYTRYMPPYGPPQPPQKKSRHVFRWVAFSVFGLIVFAVVIALIAGGGTTSTPVAQTVTSSAPASQPPATPLPATPTPIKSATTNVMAGIYTDVCNILNDGDSESDVISIVSSQVGSSGLNGQSAQQIVRNAEKKDCPQFLTPAAPAMSASQQQAVESAQSYLSDGQGFSQYGLLQQLTSSAGEGFSQADAQFAISYLKPDWNAQAVESAQGYLNDGQGFSRAELIQQLTSHDGEGFTQAQAEYAVNKVGL